MNNRRKSRNRQSHPNDCFSYCQLLHGCPGTKPKLSNGKYINEFESWCSDRSLDKAMRFYYNKNGGDCPASTLLKEWLLWTTRSVFILWKTHNSISLFRQEISAEIRDVVRSSGICCYSTRLTAKRSSPGEMFHHMCSTWNQIGRWRPISRKHSLSSRQDGDKLKKVKME
jgi:hypothetical protein